jgi:hypothetical protein
MCRAFEECAGCEAECAAGSLNVLGNRMYVSAGFGLSRRPSVQAMVTPNFFGCA